MMRSILFFVFVVSAFANVGDLIYQNCQDVSVGITLNVCATLNQGEGCNVKTKLDIDNNNVFNKDVDLSKENAACGTYSESGINCNICMNFTTPNAELMCISSQPICTAPGNRPINVAPIDGGCFQQSQLQQVRDCLNVSCPLVNGQACSGQGSCIGGKCSCNDGFSGEDCSLQTGNFESCVVIADGANICTRVLYETCRLGVRIVGISGPFEYQLYQRDISAANFKNVITQSNICENSTSICTNCLEWSGITVTENSAKGCVKMNSKCGPMRQTYDLGCFDDEKITPQCFACEADTCSSHGDCNAGICSCYSNWSGESCNIPVVCGSNCHGNGACVDNGVCSCYPGYSGDECEIGGAPEKEAPKNRAGIAFAILIPLFLIGAGIGAGAYIYMKKKKQKTTFNQFDLLEQDEADQMLD